MIDFRLFPDIIRHRDEQDEESTSRRASPETRYINDPEIHTFPLLQIVKEHCAKEDPFSVLLVGEGSIGKSTSLRLLEAELTVRGIYCARYECRHLNDRTIPAIEKEADRWPKDTVVMIDAYDELNPLWADALDDAVTVIREQGFSLIVTSRQKPSGMIYDGFTQYDVQEFSDEHNSAPVYELLRNTMFFSMYMHMDRHGISVKDIEDEASFMLRYFVFLLRDKKETNDDLSLCCDIGHAFYLRFTDGVNRRSLRLPSALRHIVTEEGDRQNGYTVSASQIRYENFFLGCYIMRELTDMPARPRPEDLERLFDLDLPTDYTDAYVYAGQLLRKEPRGIEILSRINKEYPKGYCRPYTHVLLMYLGMNRGCFNCGEIGVEVFEPRVFTVYYRQFIFAPHVGKTTVYDNWDHHRLDVGLPIFAFSDCRHLRKIDIPDSFTEIKTHAFFGCKNLEEVILPKNLRRIAGSSFENCEKLHTINIPDSVSLIKHKAFANCRSLHHIRIPSDVTEIHPGSFSGCTRLHSIDLSNNLKKIGERAFEWCDSLESIRLPEGLTGIGPYAFAYCGHLRTIDFSMSIETIGKEAFYSCNQLMSIRLPDSLIAIENGLFAHCQNLHTISFPTNVQSIGDGAFCDCGKLTSVELPEGLLSIGSGAFVFCDKLEHVVLRDGLQTIGDGAFSRCSELHEITIPRTVINIGWEAFDMDTLSVIRFLHASTDFSGRAFYQSKIAQALPHLFSLTAYIPIGSTPWYRSRLPASCTIIETDFSQEPDLTQEPEFTL